MKRKKKSGFTLLEMIIVLSISLMVMMTADFMFLSGVRVFSDTHINTDMQIEGQNVQQDISNSLCSAEKIKKVVTKDGNIIDFDNPADITEVNSIKDKWTAIKSITISVAKEDETTGEVKQKEVTLFVNGNELLLDNDAGSGKILTFNLSDENINGDNQDEFSLKFSDNEKVQFNINLMKEKGRSQAEYPISVDVLFRNRGIEIT